MDYLYDGSFEGLLCCIYEHYYREEAEGIFRRESYQQNMLRQSFCVKTEGKKAARVYEAVENKICLKALRRIYAVYLSTVPEREMKILLYVKKGFQTGDKINLLHGEPVVFDVEQAERKVYAERHRYLGILRFSVISPGGRGFCGDEAKEAPERGTPLSPEEGGEVLYAALEPDHDIVELIASHFADRYQNDPFILHDVRREKAVFAQGGHWYVSRLKKDAPLILASGEEEYRKLWKQYFKTITIRERTNPRCQKTCMPVRYWKHLTEMQGRT